MVVMRMMYDESGTPRILIRAVQALLAVFAIAAAVGTYLAVFGVPVSVQIIPDDIKPYGGNAYGITIKEQTPEEEANAVATGKKPNTLQSKLKMFEGSVELGPPNITTSEIQNNGAGRFLVTEKILYFSTSDNTDPRSNGRTYTYTDRNIPPNWVLWISVSVFFLSLFMLLYMFANYVLTSPELEPLSRLRIGQAVALTVLVSSGAVVAFAVNGVPVSGKIDPGSIRAQGGLQGPYAYVTNIQPQMFPNRPDRNEAPQASALRLWENDVELGPAHSIHQTLAVSGQGRFSHWGQNLFFSSSDGSDPRSNGRLYTYTDREYFSDLVLWVSAFFVVISFISLAYFIYSYIIMYVSFSEIGPAFFTRIAQGAMGIAAVSAVVVLVLSFTGVPVSGYLNPGYIAATKNADGMTTYSTPMAAQLLVRRSDSLSNPTASTLRLWEDDVELGPAHATHQAITYDGAGRFSYWGSTLFFSSSDGSDPRSNGRSYAYTDYEVPPDWAFWLSVVVFLSALVGFIYQYRHRIFDTDTM